MKTSDLYREWARVLDMCEGTKVDPVDCWKLNGRSQNTLPSFSGIISSYGFAVAILEGKPVFVGDKVYANNCTSALTVEGISKQRGYVFVGNCVNYDISILSWNPPKKTFMLNGEELPCPDKVEEGSFIVIDAGICDGYDRSGKFYFSKLDDRNKVADAIIKLLKGSTGNGE